MRPRSTSVCLLLACLLIQFGCVQKKSKTPSYQGKSVRYWEQQAESEKVAERRVAATALGKCGVEGLPSLMKLLNDKNHRVRANATIAVTGMGKKAIPKLKELIHDPNEEIRSEAAESLIQALLNIREKGIDDLIDLLDDPLPEVRFQAAKAFMRADQKAAKKAIPRLKKLLNNDPNKSVRTAASLSLAVLAPLKPRFEPVGKNIKRK